MNRLPASIRRCSLALAAALISSAMVSAQDPAAAPAAGQEIAVDRKLKEVPETMTQAEARVCLDRILAFFVRTQREQGQWGFSVNEGLLDSGYAVSSWYDWQVGANALACIALMESPETPERRATLEKGLHWLMTCDPPKRGSDWDNDTVWAGLYTYIACVRAAQDPRFQSKSWRALIDQRGKESFAFLARSQVPGGGWGYYDFPYPTQTPKWATSFATAAVVPALKDGVGLGWNTDAKILARSQEYVRRCALPNGAFEYDLNPIPRISGGEHINNVKGSLGRIQVCNWALASVGEKAITPDRIREGLGHFFKDHKFLDVARMRPVPHDAYYANAGYFYFFGHHYCARAITLLPIAEREAWHAKLRPHLAKTLREDGSTSDYHVQTWSVTAGSAFAAIALALGLPPHVPPQQP